MSTFKRAACAAAILASLSAFTTHASAAQTTLTISTWAPPTHGINAKMWVRFIDMMEKATDGRVTGKIRYKLASPPAQLDLVRDGAADLTWIFHGYNPGRFVVTKLAELPGYEMSSEKISVAYWRTHQKYLAQAKEHKGIKVVALTVHGPGALHSSKKVGTIAGIKGMKLRIGGGVSGDMGSALGATGIRVPAPKVYETLASHAADGVMMPMESKKGFKLTEVAQHSLTMPGGFYRGSFAMIMNQEKFDSLSKADQKALSTVFGEATSRMFGATWDEMDVNGYKASKSVADNSVTVASAADVAAYKKLAAPIAKKVLAQIDKLGIDAKAAKAYFVAEMSK